MRATGIAPGAQAWPGLRAAQPDIRLEAEDTLIDGDGSPFAHPSTCTDPAWTDTAVR